MATENIGEAGSINASGEFIPAKEVHSAIPFILVIVAIAGLVLACWGIMALVNNIGGG